MIGRSNTGGGGGLSTKNAVIHVTADAGSTISFSKGGVVVKVLDSSKQHISADDTTRAEWLYPVGSSNYGTWTVTATRDDSSSSKNVTVDSNKQYDVSLYLNRLYWEGDECVGVTNGWDNLNINAGGDYTHVNLSITKNASNIYVIGSTTRQSYGVIGTGKRVDLTNYSSLKINVTSVGVSGFKPQLAVLNANTGDEGSVFVASANLYDNGVGVATVDVSNLTGGYYIGVSSGNHSGNRGYVTFTRVWLE